MITIHFKSLLLGAIVALSIVGLMSYRKENTDAITFVASPAGMGIYNSQTRALYMYKMWNGKLVAVPVETFKVVEDGSRLTPY